MCSISKVIEDCDLNNDFKRSFTTFISSSSLTQRVLSFCSCFKIQKLTQLKPYEFITSHFNISYCFLITIFKLYDNIFTVIIT